jgi:glycosyltransferase involved in cell wall biosynthesis
VARNTGAAIAQGRYLHFLDDDDWLLPGAWESFWQLAQRSQAPWLYGGYNFVDWEGNVLQEWHPDEVGNCLVRLIAAEWLPLQASLIDSKTFFAMGGFDPSLIPYQDNDLAMRVSLHGNLAVTAALVASIVRSEETSTTDYSKLGDNVKRSREKILSASGVFPRLRHSAVTRPSQPTYWFGRITAAYLISVVWNLRRRRLSTAFSRSVYALANVALSGRRAILPGFWRGVLKPHSTRGFLCQGGVV